MSKKDFPHTSKDKSKLNSKKNIEFMQQQLDLEAIHQEVSLRQQEYNSVEEHEKYGQQNEKKTRPGQTFDQFNFEQHSRQQTECSVCTQTHFRQGRYILECKHLMCNECFKYWSAVSTKCPVCFKKTQTVLTIFHGSVRKIKIKKSHHIPSCENCSKNHNFHLMYFCDSCQKQCVHTYCDPIVTEKHAQEPWICGICNANQYRQEIQNQEREFFQSDNFEFEDYLGDDEQRYREPVDLDNAQTQHAKKPKNNTRRNQDKAGKKERRANSKNNTDRFHKR